MISSDAAKGSGITYHATEKLQSVWNIDIGEVNYKFSIVFITKFWYWKWPHTTLGFNMSENLFSSAMASTFPRIWKLSLPEKKKDFLKFEQYKINK